MTELPRRELNRIAREKAILEASLVIFAAEGYSGTTMEAVAAEAGISKPTLYQYFKNKSELFNAMMLSKRDDMMLPIEQADASALVAQLCRFAMSYAQTVMRPDLLSLARLIIGEAHRFPEIGRVYQAAGPNALLDSMKEYLTAQHGAGRLEFEDAELAAEDLWGLILSAPRNRALYDPDVQLEEADLKRFVRNGLQVFLKAYSTDPQADLAELDRAFSAS